MPDHRPAQVLTALRRLGYVDKPSVGDHVDLYKLLKDHRDGPVTIHSGVDMGTSPCSKKDLSRIRRQTLLKDDAMWSRAMRKKLSKKDYEDHLRALPKADLVPPFWRYLVEEKARKEAAAKKSKPKRSS